MAEISNKLPPGWDSKYDPRTQRFYYINHYTKQTTWDDPRLKYRQIHGTPTHVQSHPVEHIPLQHGSPEFRRNYVYPSQTCPQPAFQMPKSVQVQDLSNIRMSPAPASRTSVSMNSNNKSVSSNGTHNATISYAISRMQETNLTQVPTDTEQSVSKISTMFPTVSETHIRLLMKKYMKSIFPQVEETVLLEVLERNENNVQKASEALKKMGFEKREMKLKSKKEQKTTPAKTIAPPKVFTTEEKNAIKISLHEKYKDIPERVIIMALESVEYNKSRAAQILDIMVQEEASPKSSSDSTPKKEDNIIEESSTSTVLKKSKSSLVTPSPSIHILQCDKLDGKSRRTKEKKNSIRETLQENNVPTTNGYRSAYLIKSTGPNSNLVKGSDNGMLLEDYVSWDGPDPNLREGCRESLAKGPNKSLLLQRSYQPCGPNAEMRKGPALGLAKGSIYSQMKNLVVGESRGK